VLPPGFTSFSPSAIQDSGRVYGTLCDSTCSVTQLAYFKNGSVTAVAAIPPGSFTGPVNARGTVGGGVLVDPVNFIFRAALFRGGQVEIVPPQPGELFAAVMALNDTDTALVISFSASQITYVLYSGGKAAPINFGPSITNPSFPSSLSGTCRCINNQGIIAGTEGPNRFNGARGFRFDTRTGVATILSPYAGDPTETLAWGMVVNQRGNVLGYSFTIGITPYHERIGVWENNGTFDTFLVESTNSSELLFNDNNLIVITAIYTPPISYIVPRPGVRLSLADQVVNLPVGQDLLLITDLNNHGDMIGRSSMSANFLLERLDAGSPQAFATPVISNAPRALPSAIAVMRNRFLPQLGRLK
jgi:hypothetical protein